ncbi:MAG: SBBP repeat-containing protein [Ignavibacteria bacterium]|nr:SBBP repeat-containing protein [Ignavibacteria bacterium]
MKKLISFVGSILISFFLCTLSSLTFFNEYYIPNLGQWKNDVILLAKGNGYNLFVKNGSLNFDYFTYEELNNTMIKHGHLVKINLVNSKTTMPFFQEPSLWKLSFFYGNKPENWATDLQGYKSVRFVEVYPKIDLVLKFDGENPRYDFVVKPGGDPSQILLNFSGAYSVRTDGKTIRYTTRFGEVVNSYLFAFQNENNIVNEIPCRFVQKGDNEFSFEVGAYDKSKELIIDPIVMMSYFGGSNEDRIVKMKELSTGILLVGGWTTSNNFPTTEGAYDNSFNDIKDAFICKLDLRGSKRNLMYGTFFGGGGSDYISGLSVDEVGNIYIGGTTNSTDFPLKNPINNSINGLNDAFITKFSSDMKSLVYSTYIGGNKDDIVTSAQLAQDKGFFVCGYTESTNLPTTGGAIQTKLKGRKDIFIIKLSSSGQLVDYCTYIGGGDDDIPYDMVVSEAGNIFITGTTKSGDFPMAPYREVQQGWQTIVTESPYDRTFNGGWDAFAIKLLGDGGKLDFSTYFGGTADDVGMAVAYTADQKIIFAGITYKETTQPSFPISQNAYQNTHKGGVEIFVCGLSNIITSTGGWGLTYKRQDLDFSTFFGGSSNEYPSSLILSGKFLYMVGYTNSSNFPIVNNPTGKKIGKYDIFYAQMLSDGSGVNFTDIYGTVDDDSSSAFYLTPVGDFYIAGLTNSKNLPTINPITGSGYQGSNNILLMKYSYTDLRFDNPVGKEKVCPNYVLNIKWNSETLTANDTFDIDIKVGPTGNWEPLAHNVKGLNYAWTIPTSFYADSVWLRISHPRGIVATLANPFSVYELPTILESGSKPVNPVVCEGDSVILYLKAKGSSIKYQWLFNGSPISGATDTILVVRNIDATKKGQYKGIVSGPCPITAETPIFNIDFIPGTKILSHTNDTTVKKGQTLSLYVYATGDKLSYQWYKDDQRLIGATENKFEIKNVSKADEGIYKCRVTGTCGEKFTQPIKVDVDTVIVSVENSKETSFKYFISGKHQLTIEFFAEVSHLPSSINIYNPFGQKINNSNYKVENSGNRISISLENLATGIYFVEIEIGNTKHWISLPLIK